MKSPQEFFKELQAEIRFQGLVVKQIPGISNYFSAQSPILQNTKTQVVAVLNLKDGTYIFIKKDGKKLDDEAVRAVIQKHGDFFDVTPRGELFILIPAQLKACRDMEKVAEVVTSAYFLAAKFEK